METLYSKITLLDGTIGENYGFVYSSATAIQSVEVMIGSAICCHLFAIYLHIHLLSTQGQTPRLLCAIPRVNVRCDSQSRVDT